MEGEEAAKAFQVIKDDREALFKKLKDRKGGKGGKFGMKKKAPKNKKITFDDDEPAEKKVKGTCSKTFFRTNVFVGIFGAMEDRTSSVLAGTVFQFQYQLGTVSGQSWN